MKWLHRLMNPDQYIRVDTIQAYTEMVREEARRKKEGLNVSSELYWFYDGYDTNARHMLHDLNHGRLQTRIRDIEPPKR